MAHEDTILEAVKSPKVLARFWAKVNKTEGCWLWTACRNDRGYGYFGVGPRVLSQAHRVSWMIASGRRPNAYCIMHLCDNPRCVRPDHLREGSLKENSRDSTAKGRWCVGVDRWNATMDPARVVELRRRFDAKENREVLAAAFGISLATCYQIGRRVTWKHVPEETNQGA